MTDYPNCHKGHRRYIGGIMDGQIAHLTGTHPSDYPQTIGTVLRNGQRSWYELDYERSAGTEAVYRCIGIGGTWADAAARGFGDTP